MALVLVGALYGICQGEGVGIAPEVEVAKDGKVTVRWETEHRCVAPKVSFGLDFEEDPFGEPSYRQRVSAKGSSRSHVAETTLKSIEEIARGTTFNGKVFYRATCFDLDSKVWLDTGDCVFRYVGGEGSYPASRGVAIIEGPIVANVTSNSALVRWVTDMPSVGRVRVGERAIQDGAAGKEHEVVVSNLQPDTPHIYRVETWTDGTDLLRTRLYSFRTAPEPPPSAGDAGFAFAVFSDTRSHDYSPVSIQALNGVNAQTLRQIALGAFRKDVRFAVVPGDLIYGTTSDAHKAELQLRSWKKAVGPIAHYIPFYTGIGNHDAEIYDYQVVERKRIRVPKKGRDAAEEIFRREMTNPTNGPELREGSTDPTYCENVYSFDYGNSHFVMLNNDYKAIAPLSGESERGKIVGSQLEWLQSDLKSATERGHEHIFVFIHEPAFPNGGHLDDSMYYNGNEAYVKPRDEFWRLLCQPRPGGVVAVFCGHEHNYSRMLVDRRIDESFSRPIWQIVTGGGGAPCHSQDKPPWREHVEAFSPRHHYCIVSVAGRKVQLGVYDPAGNLMDRADLK